MDFTPEQIKRYARHIIMPQVGGEGQRKLRDAKVCLIGAGGLGSPMALYLAAAGIGTIGLVDDDHVELSNLQRQVIHDTERVGTLKTESARARLLALNPEIQVICHTTRFSVENAQEIIQPYDVIADGTDRFSARYLINDACYLEGKTLVSAALLQFEGQLATFRPARETESLLPCYRCLFPTPPAPGITPNCAQAGVFGALAGIIGTLQATEILKEILGIGESLAGQFLIYDALSNNMRKFKAPHRPNCALCGTDPSLTDLSHHPL